MSTLPLAATDCIPLVIRPHAHAGIHDYTARWRPGTETLWAGPEILDESGDVVADEACETVEAGQAWVDRFDFDELERKHAERIEREYRRLGWED